MPNLSKIDNSLGRHTESEPILDDVKENIANSSQNALSSVLKVSKAFSGFGTTQNATVPTKTVEQVQLKRTSTSELMGSVTPSFMVSHRQSLNRLRQKFHNAASKALGSPGKTTLPLKQSQDADQSTFTNNSKDLGQISQSDTPGKLSKTEFSVVVSNCNSFLKSATPMRQWSVLDKSNSDSNDRDLLDSLNELRRNIAPTAESNLELNHRKSTPTASFEEVRGSQSEITPFFNRLQEPKRKPILVLDLDETLIHSSLIPRRASDFWIEVVQNNDARTREVFWVYKRPGVDRFLLDVADYYTLFVFTAGIREYASQILDRLDPTGALISGRLYRDECSEIKNQGTFAKDLTKICGDLERVILVDNTPACYSLQPANGLPIKSWYTDLSDRQLYRLRDFLLEISTVPDLRVMIPEWSTA